MNTNSDDYAPRRVSSLGELRHTWLWNSVSRVHNGTQTGQMGVPVATLIQPPPGEAPQSGLE